VIARDRQPPSPQPGGPPPAPEGTPDDTPATARDAALICRACGHAVTHPRHRIGVQGHHQHRFMNPGGFVYEIGCFADAVGCVNVGPPSLEYPWFAGYAWRCAHCAGCGVQLGWHFRAFAGAGAAAGGGSVAAGAAAGGGFFGLILDRLREAPGPAPSA
jgi:hypothetical protein